MIELYVEQIKDLIERLNKYRDAYYNDNQSLISDMEYDSLYDQLVEMENKYGVIMSNSPTQTVGYDVVSELKKVKHNHPLLSLAKTTEITKFVDYFRNQGNMLLMAKLDGLTCSLYYNNGELVRAETRGNGEIGEDITHNAKMFSNIPLHIDYKDELIVDGECIITTDEFDRINERENTQYKNPRNLVSGTVRQLDNKVVKNRNVQFLAWKLYSMGEDKKIDSHYRRLFALSNLGFDIVPCDYFDTKVNPINNESCQLGIEIIKEKCKVLNTPIDGIVGMFDSKSYGDYLGKTGHHPRHSLAYKFYQEENETTLTDIEWSTSRTGSVNPVAIFEPVEIDGTTVSRATLNNVSCIKELELGIGDTITVIKSNQIIPMVTQNLTRSNTYKIPSVCPCCGEPTVIKNDNGREMLYCVNKDCAAILHDRIANFAARNGMNIVGISEERLKILIDNGYIKCFKDLYHLYEHKDEIVGLDGFGKSSVDNILKAVEESRKCTLTNILVAIGIPNIGKSTAKTISEHCEKKYIEDSDIYKNPFDYFLSCIEYRQNWSSLPAIGKLTSEVINNYVEENIFDIYDLLYELEVELEFVDSDSKQKPFADKLFCITGKLNYFTNRNALIEEIEKLGGKATSSVTSKTDYLITNDKDSGSSKNKKAQQYGTEIISEDEFIKLSKKLLT